MTMHNPEWRPYSVNIELTLACNLRCEHCGSTAGRQRADELTAAEWERCFAELADLGCAEVCLLGGEPLLHREWERLCRAVGDQGLELVLITNGTRVTPEVARTLGGMKHLARVGVSIDAADPSVHDAIRGRAGSHVRAVAAIERLLEEGLEVGVITTLSRRNLDQLPALREWLLGRNITWQIQMASVGGERFAATERLTPEQFYSVGEFIAECRKTDSVSELPLAGSHDMGYFPRCFPHVGELSEWYGCGAGLYTLGITSDGRVKGCLSQHEDFVEDSVRRRSLVAIWNDPELFGRNRRFRKEQLHGECAGCVHGEQCRAGCSNVAYTTTGDPFDNPFCFHRIEEGK